MATLGELRSAVLRMIGNAEGEGLNDGLILDAIRAAHDAILPWSPKMMQATVTGDGTSRSFDLPSDFYLVEAVLVNLTGETLPMNVFSPFSYYGESISNTNSWILMPDGKIMFAKALDTDEVYDLYYCATWTKPTETSQEGDELEPPGYLMYAMTLYTASCILLPDAAGIAGIGSYKTRVDSGNPEHNPVEKFITFLLNQFNQEMNRHPKHQKAQV